jgi:hypothetical protein
MLCYRFDEALGKFIGLLVDSPVLTGSNALEPECNYSYNCTPRSEKMQSPMATIENITV